MIILRRKGKQVEANYTVKDAVEVCMAFECKCSNKGDCDHCELMNNYTAYCDNDEKTV
jgi:hypothetical protein